MVRKKLVADLDPWIATASLSLIGSFASDIIRDKAAVRAAITEPWSNCAYRKSNPAILIVQSAQDGTANNASDCLGGAWYRCILVQEAARLTTFSCPWVASARNRRR